MKTDVDSTSVAPKDPPDALPSGASETAPHSPQSNRISLLCKRYATNYFEVPEEVLEDAEELTAWAREGAARKGKRKAPAVPSGRGSRRRRP